MFKIFVICGLYLISSVALASPVEQMMTIKERLRISLWVEGLDDNLIEKSRPQSKRVLPEEIERALRKL
ncbi:MAG: hypothetical protein H0V66_08130 [Bdellovibrionales bacterium]|nr:hypothetical protein [Bdellovibrionales bacterium]